MAIARDGATTHHAPALDEAIGEVAMRTIAREQLLDSDGGTGAAHGTGERSRVSVAGSGAPSPVEADQALHDGGGSVDAFDLDRRLGLELDAVLDRLHLDQLDPPANP